MTGALVPSSIDPQPAADELLRKPFDLDELLDLVGKYAGRRIGAAVAAGSDRISA